MQIMANQPLLNLQENPSLKNVEAEIEHLTSKLIDEFANKIRQPPVCHDYQ